MSDFEQHQQDDLQPLAAPAVVHHDPKQGGSYTRDTTGALVNNDPAAAAQLDQE